MRETGLGFTGEPESNSMGIASKTIIYNENGRPVEIACFTENFNPVDDINLVSVTKYEYDVTGLQVGIPNFGH